MKKLQAQLLALAVYICCQNIVLSQTDADRTIINSPESIDYLQNQNLRYGRDYRLINETILQNNPAILEGLKMITIDFNRKLDEDFIFFHPKLEVEFLIYSKQYCADNGYPIIEVIPGKKSNEPNTLEDE